MTVDPAPIDPVTIDELLADARARITPRAQVGDLDTVRTAGGLVIDIRPAELRDRDGALPAALVIDRNVLEWRLDPKSPHKIADVRGYDQPIVLVCNEGYASSLAAATLRDLGLRHATDLDGGFQAWKAAAAARA